VGSTSKNIRFHVFGLIKIGTRRPERTLEEIVVKIKIVKLISPS